MITVEERPIAADRHTDRSVVLSCPDLSELSEVSIHWRYDGDQELVQVLMLVRHIRDVFGIQKIFLYLPYVPYARMDRVQDVTEVFTLKHFAGFINSLGFDKVYVFDPHSSVTPALIDHVVVRNPSMLIREADLSVASLEGGQSPLYFYPDEGAMKKYSKLSNRPAGYGQKVRDWKTREITGLTVYVDDDAIRGKPVLIIDDICALGNTVLHTAKALKAKGAGNVYLCASHCEKAVLSSELLTSGFIERIFTTDSIMRDKHDMIFVYPLVANRMTGLDTKRRNLAWESWW